MLIKNGYILTMNKNKDVYECADIRIDGTRISQIGKDLQSTAEEQVLDAAGKLVIPGLINCHLHSDSNLFKGYFDNLPLDLWMLNAIPLKDYGPLSGRLIYLRTLLGAIEMLKCGVTCVQDDPSEFPFPTVEGFSHIMNAYRDIGMRSSVACHFADKAEYDKLPYFREYLTPELYDELTSLASEGFQSTMDFYEAFADAWHGRDDGMFQVVVSPSTPHRCTDGALLAALEFSRRRDAQINIHGLETKSQALAGPLFYEGRSLVGHCYDLGLLSKRTTLIHAVWATDEDIALLAQTGANVAHNPVSNLKLGSGIAPLRKLLDAGVNVGLGTDGTSSNDSQNLFDVIKLAGLLHKVTVPDYTQWPNAPEILTLATNGSARACGRGEEVGSLEVGKKADITLFSLDTVAFTPLINPYNQLVYCEHGESVDTVIVDGKIVVQGHRVVAFDEKAVYREIQGLMPAFLKEFERAVRFGNKVLPCVAKVYERCMREPFSINRLSGDETEWIERKG